MILGDANKQWKSPLSQQGDCLVKKVGTFDIFEKEYAAIPKDAKETNSNVVLKGELNSHALYGGEFTVYDHDGVTFLKVIKPTVLDHVKDSVSMEKAEHHAQWIPIGEYFIDQVQERDHIKEESRAIID